MKRFFRYECVVLCADVTPSGVHVGVGATRDEAVSRLAITPYAGDTQVLTALIWLCKQFAPDFDATKLTSLDSEPTLLN